MKKFNLILLFLFISINVLSKAINVYVERAEQLTTCNFDFRYATNIPKNQRINYTNTQWKPESCINTVTSIYNKNNTCTYCPHFVKNPKKWKFKEVKNPEPGDLVIFINKSRAFHAGIIVKNSLIGPLMNHANGGFFPNTYRKHDPVLIYKLVTKTIKIKYYRYIG